MATISWSLPGCPGSPDEDGDGVTVADGDCDDLDARSYPGADEICDGRDNDCDGEVPDAEADADGDGILGCGGDCDDGNAAVHPGADELCNGIDDDCDGSVAEEDDGDGDGYAPCGGDCDDDDPHVSPGAADECGGEDSDCDGDPDTHGGGSCIDCTTRVPDDEASLQDAIDLAGDGDVICIVPGTYTGADLTFWGRPLHVVGLAGPRYTVLDGEGSGTVLVIDDGEGEDTILEGLTVTGGHARNAGGIRIEGASPVLRNLIVKGNSVFQQGEDSGCGGGIWAADSSSRMERLTVTENQADEDGAGIWILDSTPSLTDVTAEGNDAGLYGGGLYAQDSVVLLERVVLSDNSAGIRGGGAWLGGGEVSGSDLTVSDNTTGDCDGCGAGGVELSWASATLDGLQVSRNSSREGGGIHVNGTATLTGAVLSHNDATGSGGGLLVDDGSVELRYLRLEANVAGAGAGLWLGNGGATVEGAVVAGNTSLGHGGGIQLVDATLDLSGVTLGGNTAAGEGGGIHQTGAAFTAENVTLSHNVADSGGGIHVLSGSDPDLRYCNVWGNDGGDLSGFEGDPIGQTGNLSADPGFGDIQPDDPGAWDLHLSPDSPLVGGGNPTWLDPDGSPSDVGAYGGEGAGGWDLDRDGHPEWWQPGPYDPTVHGPAGWDCDDRDPHVGPGNGCEG